MTGRVHMIGIGGIGMSAVAQILLARGTPVSGSDAHESAMTKRLQRLGAAVTIGHRAESVEGADRVVLSDAIRPDNPELQRARELGISVQRRSEALAELMVGRKSIAISGTHGKTTVAAMVAAILVEAGLDPTAALGGSYAPLGGNARAGDGEWFVVEACEAYESFLHLRPEVAVVTNIEPDHLDHHKTEAHLRAAFSQFLARVPQGGCVVLCADRPELREVSAGLERQIVTYGFNAEAEVQGTEVQSDHDGGRCRLRLAGEEAGELRVAAPGTHNVMNALCAVAAARLTGAPLEACLAALSRFEGAERRFQVLGEARGVTLVDDYAHHPTEVAATIATARSAFPGRRILAVFQPHLYSRTRHFAAGFARALGEADAVVVADIYPARESPLPGVSSGLIAEPLRSELGEDVVWEMAKDQVASELPARTRPGDVVLVMGAGDIWEAARDLAQRLGIEPAGEREVAAKK